MLFAPPVAGSALFTDLYELTMAYGFYRAGRADDEAVFSLFFRRTPFAGGYAIACGLGPILDYLRAYRFAEDDLSYLATLTNDDGTPLFDREFLGYLGKLELSVDVDAAPEGTVVFAHEPILRVRGPLLQAQLLEGALLTLVNFNTLIATKAARVCDAARGDPVLEFGLRRAQGVDGALSASRAAYIGGCAATSNVLAGKLFGIPVKGTHAHSWVMAFDTELEAFDAYANALPSNCVFLVDTYDTLEGVEHAIQVGERLRKAGKRLLGVRLDSGDLAWLSARARKMLDAAGFADASVVGSSDLDEYLIRSLKDQGARIGVWGVGTRLVTGRDDPALGGVYKLSAIRAPGKGPWRRVIKLSNQIAKTSTPGVLQVRRFSEEGVFAGDCIFDEEFGIEAEPTMLDPVDFTRHKHFGAQAEFEDLLVPCVRAGVVTFAPPSLPDLRARARSQLEKLDKTIRRLENPHEYPVGLEPRLHALRTELVLRVRGRDGEGAPPAS